MAITLQLNPADEDLLRRCAARENRTTDEVAAIAVREYAARLDAADEEDSPEAPPSVPSPHAL